MSAFDFLGLPGIFWVLVAVLIVVVAVVWFILSNSRRANYPYEGDSRHGHHHRQQPQRPKVNVSDVSSLNKALNQIFGTIDDGFDKVEERQGRAQRDLAEIRADVLAIRQKLTELKWAMDDTKKPLSTGSPSGGAAPDLQGRLADRAPASAVDATRPRAVEDAPLPVLPIPQPIPVNPAVFGPTVESLVTDYNENPQDIKRRFEVRDFTVANMQAMGKGQGAKPVFRFTEAGQGEYWLICLDGISYAVPRYKAIYNLGQFESGGMNRVFDCRGFVEGQRYRKLEVVKPAKFREVDRDELEVVEQGILELRQGEKEL
jgi:hypothetical protein